MLEQCFGRNNKSIQIFFGGGTNLRTEKYGVLDQAVISK